MARPLLALWHQMDRDDPGFRFVDSTIRLWSVMFHYLTHQRRYNVMCKTDPTFLPLLTDPSAFSPSDSAVLFGDHFLASLVREADRDTAFRRVERSSRLRQTRASGSAFRRRPEQFGGQPRDFQRRPSFHGSTPRIDAQQPGRFSSFKYDLSSFTPTAARLSHFVDAWRAITNDPWVLSSVTHGVLVDFLSPPVQHLPPIVLVMPQALQAVGNAEVSALLSKQAITQCPFRPPDVFISTLFMIKKHSGGHRPVINLRDLNRHVRQVKFKMEGLEPLKSVVRPRDWLVKFVLQDAFLTVPLAVEHRRFFCFQWNGELYHFNCLPFGLSSAPRTFTKLLKPAVAYLRQRGVRCVVYLDDILLLNSSPSAILSDLHLALDLFSRLGFIINWSKSSLIPSQRLEFLGLIVDTVEGTLLLPPAKLKTLAALCSQLLSSQRVRLRDLAVVMGHMTWAIPTVPYARAHYRGLQLLYNSHLQTVSPTLDCLVRLDEPAISDLHWWLDRLRSPWGKPFFISAPDLTIYSDASLTGWGVVAMIRLRVVRVPSKRDTSI